MKHKLLIITFLLFSIASFKAKAFESKSAIHNFTPIKIYYTSDLNTTPEKLASFEFQTLAYYNKNISLNVFLSKRRKTKGCVVKMDDKKDVFITIKNGHLQCKTRAERLPKEF